MAMEDASMIGWDANCQGLGSGTSGGTSPCSTCTTSTRSQEDQESCHVRDSSDWMLNQSSVIRVAGEIWSLLN